MAHLVERYLAAVERRLPEETAKDIVAELREALSAEIEAREAALGRAANDDEVAAVIRGFGAPSVVAARYEGRSALIGPVLYPWFWPAQRTAVGITVAVFIVMTAIRAVASDEPVRTMLRSMDNVIGWGLAAFAAVTLVFIAVERWGDPAKLSDKLWNPKAMPHEHIRKPRSMFESGISLFFDAVFILVWLKFIPVPNDLPLRDGASVSIALSPVWESVYWPILMLAVLGAAGHAHDMVRPAWTRIRSAMSIVGYAGGLAVLWVLFRARPLVDVQPRPGTGPEDLERALRLVDGVITVSLGVAALVCAIGLGVEVWRQVKASRAETSAAPLMAA